MYLRSEQPSAGLLLGLCLAGCQAGAPPHDSHAPAQPANPASAAECRNCSTATLENTYWKLLRLGNKTVTAGERGREPHITLVAENRRVQGLAGCNRLLGGYRLEGEELRFQGMATTRMACAEGMDLEVDFLRMLESAARWKIQGERLQLFDAQGGELAEFESRYLR